MSTLIPRFSELVTTPMDGLFRNNLAANKVLLDENSITRSAILPTTQVISQNDFRIGKDSSCSTAAVMNAVLCTTNFSFIDRVFGFIGLKSSEYSWNTMTGSLIAELARGDLSDKVDEMLRDAGFSTHSETGKRISHKVNLMTSMLLQALGCPIKVYTAGMITTGTMYQLIKHGYCIIGTTPYLKNRKAHVICINGEVQVNKLPFQLHIVDSYASPRSLIFDDSRTYITDEARYRLAGQGWLFPYAHEFLFNSSTPGVGTNSLFQELLLLGHSDATPLQEIVKGSSIKITTKKFEIAGTAAGFNQALKSELVHHHYGDKALDFI